MRSFLTNFQVSPLEANTLVVEQNRAQAANLWLCQDFEFPAALVTKVIIL